MSIVLLEFAKSFVRGKLSAEVFTEAYMELWKIERDNDVLIKDEAKLSECISSIFCLTDLYNSDPDKEEYELNDEQLCDQVHKLITNLSSQ